MRVGWTVHVAPNWRCRPIISMDATCTHRDSTSICHAGNHDIMEKWGENESTSRHIDNDCIGINKPGPSCSTTFDKSKSSTFSPLLFTLIAGLSLSKRWEKEEGKWDSWKWLLFFLSFVSARESESIQFPLAGFSLFIQTHTRSPSPLWLLSNQLAQAQHFLVAYLSTDLLFLSIQ